MPPEAGALLPDNPEFGPEIDPEIGLEKKNPTILPRSPCTQGEGGRMNRPPISTVIGLVLAFGFSCVLALFSVPLAFLLGPLVLVAGLSLAGMQIRPPRMLQRVGQLTVGATVGLNMTSEILLHLAAWLPLMVASAGFSVLVAAAASVLLGRWALIDTKTAYFASLPGGLAEMANVGAQVGADPEPIAVVQTVRVALLVLAVPPMLFHFGVSPSPVVQTYPDMALPWLPALLLGGAGLSYLFGLLRLNNPWMIGATIAAAALTASGLVTGHMPQPLFLAAQFFIGSAVGSRFRPFMIRRLPRVTFYGMISVGLLGIVMVAFSFLLAALTGIDLTTAILSTSPGGMSEMAATAQVLNLAVATVVAFQIVRALMVNAFAVHFWNGLTRIGFFAVCERAFGRK